MSRGDVWWRCVSCGRCQSAAVHSVNCDLVDLMYGTLAEMAGPCSNGPGQETRLHLYQ